MVGVFKPNLLLDFGYGPLEEAIAYRSRAQMNQILQKKGSRAPDFERLSNERFSPMELAIGWPSGLQSLLDEGFSADAGCRLSMYMEDLRSTELILAAESFPRDIFTWTDVLRDLNNYSQHMDEVVIQQMQEVVIQTLARRRQTLAKLAIKALPEEEVLRLGLRNEITLDAALPGVYQELKKRSVNMPQSLNPASLYLLSDPIYVSIYTTIGFPIRRLLESLYTNGFESVDTPDEWGRTPLLLACWWRVEWAWTAQDMLSVCWLLDKGACPEFSGGDWYPNVLFYVAISYAGGIRVESRDFSGDLIHLIQRSASLCDSLCPDGCQCYCSSEGCLPVHKFWRCDALKSTHEGCGSMASDTLFKALDKWLCLCGINAAQSETCYEEIFRLEVFDRLGLAHTCCAAHCDHQLDDQGDGLLIQTSSSMDEKDRKQLQEDDSELKAQLDLIVQGYQNRYKKHAGDLSDFWKSCTQDLDGILPELTPKERCRCRCTSFYCYKDYECFTEYAEKERELQEMRRAKEAEALAKRGYLGLDFIDVIRHHFADSLDPGSSDPAGSS